jgi:ABC-type branched-subunit amino acid transport system substrate-binding protein
MILFKKIPLLALALLFALGGCDEISSKISPKEEPPSPMPSIEILNIGVFVPLKGESAPSGESLLNGLAMAAEEINAAGGVLGRPIRLVVRDTRNRRAGRRGR